MTKETIELNKTTCLKCDGDGKNFKTDAYKFFRRWRKEIGATQEQIAIVLKTSKHELSRFENGRGSFGETRMRKLAEILSSWSQLQAEADKEFNRFKTEPTNWGWKGKA